MKSDLRVGPARELRAQVETEPSRLQRRTGRRPGGRLGWVAAMAVTAIAGLAGAPAFAAGVEVVFGPQALSAPEWLAKQGFRFMIDAGNPSRARFSLGERGLTVETLARAEPMLAR